MGFFRKIILLSALVLIAMGGYFYFVASEAPNFFLWGDLENNGLILFVIGGIMIFVWLVSGLFNEENR